MPLRVSWVARSDLGTLTGAEANGPPLSLKGDALLSAMDMLAADGPTGTPPSEMPADVVGDMPR